MTTEDNNKRVARQFEKIWTSLKLLGPLADPLSNASSPGTMNEGRHAYVGPDQRQGLPHPYYMTRK
jgi:hypothetical protein